MKNAAFSVLYCLFVFAAGLEAETVLVAEDGKALLPVVTEAQAEKEVKAAADTLAHYLERITGASFERIEGAKAAGIMVGTYRRLKEAPYADRFSDDLFRKEDYAIVSEKEKLWLVGASPMGVENAVWDLLFRLGYRQFFPNENWEIVPEKKKVEINLKTFETPDYIARRIWYNWGMRWGYNVEPYRRWCKRNRVRRGVAINSGHAYGAIVSSHRRVFKEHPEYYALIDGKRTGNKMCISNPEVRKLVVDYAVNHFRTHPGEVSISMEPSDGGGWCECAKCNAMGPPSDRALLLANEVAEAVNALGLGEKYVGMYAYNEHGAPPTVKVHQNVVLSVATGFLRGGYTLEQIIDGWSRQGARLGIYDYFSVVAWDWNMPRQAGAARPHKLAASIRDYYRKGARFYDCESGDAWGPYGLGYYIAGRVFWDIDNAGRVDALIEDFLVKCFGPAFGPMKKFYALLCEEKKRRSTADLLARMYRKLSEARKLAAHEPSVKTRIDDLVKYTRYVELYHNYAGAAGDAKKAAKEAVLKFCYRIRETSMVHSYGLWARLIGQKAAHTDGHPLKDDRPVTEGDILRYLREGVASFTPVTVDFEVKEYSRKLVPAAAALGFPEVAPGRFPDVPQSRHTYFTWVEKAPAAIAFDVRVKKVWQQRSHEIKLFSLKQVHVEPVAVFSECKPDNELRHVTMKTPYAGLHRIEVYDGADFTRITWPQAMHVTIPTGMDTKTVNQQFRGGWTMYFYVPKGTRVVGGWAARIASWAPRVSGVMKNAQGEVVYDFAKKGAGWFRVPVAKGRDGTLWKFESCQGERRLVTVPPYVAPTGKQLLLPAEVVEADRG